MTDPINGEYIYDYHTKNGWGVLEICHGFVDSIVFEQLIHCSFLQRVKLAGRELKNANFL